MKYFFVCLTTVMSLVFISTAYPSSEVQLSKSDKSYDSFDKALQQIKDGNYQPVDTENARSILNDIFMSSSFMEYEDSVYLVVISCAEVDGKSTFSTAYRSKGFLGIPLVSPVEDYSPFCLNGTFRIGSKKFVDAVPSADRSSRDGFSAVSFECYKDGVGSPIIFPLGNVTISQEYKNQFFCKS